MKKAICIIGLIFGLACATLGSLMLTGNLSFSTKADVSLVSKTDSEDLKAYRYGADFYTEVSKGLYGINESLQAINTTQTSAFKSAINTEIDSAYSISKTIEAMFGLLEITIGFFIFLFFFMKLFSITKVNKE